MRVLDKARRRGMRGLIKRMRMGGYVFNRCLHWTGSIASKHRHCNWCGEPVDEPRRRNWHSHCLVWSGAAYGQGRPQSEVLGQMPSFAAPNDVWNKWWKQYTSTLFCAECGVMGRRNIAFDEVNTRVKLDIDHRLAISVAMELGRKAIMVAFMPDNLQYLCHDCHVAKTKKDMAILAMLRGKVKMPTPHPQLSLQWAEN